jgi:hypothetical protein
LELFQLRTFRVVAETLNFTRAAERLGLTQSAVSHQITIAVSEARLVTPIARRTILGDDALGVRVPILEDVLGLDRPGVRSFFQERGLTIREWDRARTDRPTIESPDEVGAAGGIA